MMMTMTVAAGGTTTSPHIAPQGCTWGWVLWHCLMIANTYRCPETQPHADRVKPGTVRVRSPRKTQYCRCLRRRTDDIRWRRHRAMRTSMTKTAWSFALPGMRHRTAAGGSLPIPAGSTVPWCRCSSRCTGWHPGRSSWTWMPVMIRCMEKGRAGSFTATAVFPFASSASGTCCAAVFAPPTGMPPMARLKGSGGSFRRSGRPGAGPRVLTACSALPATAVLLTASAGRSGGHAGAASPPAVQVDHGTELPPNSMTLATNGSHPLQFRCLGSRGCAERCLPCEARLTYVRRTRRRKQRTAGFASPPHAEGNFMEFQ